MYFVLVNSSFVNIIHDNGEDRIITSIKEFSKTKLIQQKDNGDFIDPFVEINGFIKESLTAKQRDRMFQLYKDIFDEINNNIYDIDLLIDNIATCFSEIYSLVTVDGIEGYMAKKDIFNIPDDIKETFTGEYDEDRTYNRSKYRGLLALAVAAKLALPVWGEYSQYRKPVIGSNRITIPLLKMLGKSSILDSRQFKEFELYTSATVDAGTHEDKYIVSGIGTESNYHINISSNFVKKVAIGLNIKSNALAQNIYNFTANRGAYSDGNIGRVFVKQDTGLDEERSRLEKFAIREVISQGDVSMIEYYMSDTDRIMRGVTRQDTNQYQELVNDLAKYLNEKNYMPNDMNIRLMQWVLQYVVPPKTVSYVGLYYQRQALAAVFGSLMVFGFPSLAAMVISEEAVSEEGQASIYNVMRRGIPTSIQTKLEELYPVTLRDRDNNNMALQAISVLFNRMNNNIFRVVAPDVVQELLVKEGVLNKYLKHTVLADTPTELASMLIKVHEVN